MVVDFYEYRGDSRHTVLKFAHNELKAWMTIFFPHYLLGLETRRFHDDLEEKVDKILHKVSDITAKLHNLTDAVRKFEQCKAWGPIRGFRDTGY